MSQELAETIKTVEIYKRRHNRNWKIKEIKGAKSIEVINKPVSGICCLFDSDVGFFASLRSVGCNIRIESVFPLIRVVIQVR